MTATYTTLRRLQDVQGQPIATYGWRDVTLEFDVMTDGPARPPKAGKVRFQVCSCRRPLVSMGKPVDTGAKVTVGSDENSSYVTVGGTNQRLYRMGGTLYTRARVASPGRRRARLDGGTRAA